VGNTACTELLDESYSQVVSEKYSPTNDADISYLVNAAYIPLRQTMLLWNGVVRSEELCADQDVIPARLGIGWVDGYIYKRWHQHVWTTEDDGVLQGWERTFEGINTCNRLLSQIEDGVIGVTGDAKTELVSELKVLRASYYYILCDLYGNVPIVTDFKDTNLPQQSTRKEVYDFIVDKAVEFKLGARGLRSIVETIMMDEMFVLPSSGKKSFHLTLDEAKQKISREELSRFASE
jgi:hypothetical protein